MTLAPEKDVAMDQSDAVRGRLHGSHWGAFYPLLRDGRVVGIEPFDHDPDPSPILRNIPGALEHHTRIRQPMIREGWRPGASGDRRREGASFVPVSWEDALGALAR